MEPQVVFQDFANLYSPRVVFRLPGPVFNLRNAESQYYGGLVIQFMAGEMMRHFWGQRLGRNPFTWKNTSVTNSLINIGNKINNMLASVGGTTLNYSTAGLYQMPDLIAVPLQSNIDQYGPWYAAGAQGMLAFDENVNFVPWNFGDYDTMDQAGTAAVQQAISQYMQHEAGSVKFPGIPTITLGDALAESGPYVTNIECAIAPDGVTTTYTMGTWTPHPYKMRKEFVDYIGRVSRQMQDARHTLRVLSRQTDNNAELVAGRIQSFVNQALDPPLHKSKHSPVLTIGGHIDQTDDSAYAVTVALDTDYGFAASLGQDGYQSTFGGTLDSVFVPFSSNQSGYPLISSGVPHFGLSTVTGSGNPTVDDLNPFTIAYDSSGNVLSDVFFAGLVRDSGFPSSLVYDSANDDTLIDTSIRAVALRAPLVLAGWGYDTLGNPTPSGDPNADGSIPFASGYKVNANAWQCGPVDLRWDDSRKVWAPGTNTANKIVQILNDNSVGSGGLFQRVYSVQEYAPTFNQTAGRRSFSHRSHRDKVCSLPARSVQI